jgi:hypothetical protein
VRDRIGSLVWEPQFALDRLEARLVAQRVEQRVSLESLQTWSSPACSCFEPLQGLRGVSPLRLDRGVYSRTTVTPKLLQLGERGFRIDVPSELVAARSPERSFAH